MKVSKIQSYYWNVHGLISLCALKISLGIKTKALTLVFSNFIDTNS